MTRQIDWPENVFYAGAIPGADRDAVILLGVEPNYRWRDLHRHDADLARELGVELVVTLGALLADVPHTRPAPVTGSATDADARRGARAAAVAVRGADRHRRRPPRRLPAAGIPSVSLWAAVPHYVSLAPSPRAAKALCIRLGELLGVHDRRSASSRRPRRSTREQISEAVATDPETAEYVAELERRADTLERVRSTRPTCRRASRSRPS